VGRWRSRYKAAVRRLEQAHVPTTRDRRAGFDRCKSMRAEWDRDIAAFAAAMTYDLPEIDPVGADRDLSGRQADFADRRRAAP
jgi:hypothetical protein